MRRAPVSSRLFDLPLRTPRSSSWQMAPSDPTLGHLEPTLQPKVRPTVSPPLAALPAFAHGVRIFFSSLFAPRQEQRLSSV